MDLDIIFKINNECLNCNNTRVDKEEKFYCKLSGLKLTKKENELTCKFESISESK